MGAAEEEDTKLHSRSDCTLSRVVAFLWLNASLFLWFVLFLPSVHFRSTHVFTHHQRTRTAIFVCGAGRCYVLRLNQPVACVDIYVLFGLLIMITGWFEIPPRTNIDCSLTSFAEAHDRAPLTFDLEKFFAIFNLPI